MAAATAHALPARGQPPEILSVNPPGITIGRKEALTIEGRNLRVDAINIEGVGIWPGFDYGGGKLVGNVLTAFNATPGIRALRVERPNGFSNLRLIRLDRLPQIVEIEPNETPDQATLLTQDSVGVGKLGPQDVDDYRVRLGQGDPPITIEIEARRLGIAMAPVLTVMTPDGRALKQGRETPGVEGDCRFLFRPPASGYYIIQVRDNLYGGSDGMAYRLRVTHEPFATGLFPLGGAPGRSLAVTATGGNLAGSVSQTIDLPDRPGTVVELPEFQTSGVRFTSPGRVIVGDGPDQNESADGITPLKAGTTINARIDRPREVDRFRIEVKAGEIVQLKVVAAPLGSWLDAVLSVRDADGKHLAENDDPASQAGKTLSNDSRVEFRAGSDGDLTVEVADRYGRGGPEYAYRLTAGPYRPELYANARRLRPTSPDFDLSEPNGPPNTGAYSLKPGAAVSIVCEIAVEGKTGPITVRAEELPEGVTSAPVTVRARHVDPKDGMRPGPAQAILVLRAEPGAKPVSGRFRVVARASPNGGRELERVASDTVRIDNAGKTSQARPVYRLITEFPIRVMTP